MGFWQCGQRSAGTPPGVCGPVEVLSELGLDVAALSARSEQAALSVQADVERGLRDGVHSTPSFFFNGAPHDGHYDIETLRAQIAQAPERAG